VSHAYSLAFALHFAGLLHQCRHDVQSVHERADAELALANVHGFVEWSAGSMILKGWALAQQGIIEDGIERLCQGFDSWLTKGNELGKTQILARLAEAYGKARHTEEGLHVLAEALVAVRTNGERHFEAELYRLKGELLLQSEVQRPRTQSHQQHVVEIEACFRQALDIARRQQAKSLELRAAMSLARLLKTQGKPAEARQILTESYSWFTEGFDTTDLQEAQALIATLTDR